MHVQKITLAQNDCWLGCLTMCRWAISYDRNLQNREVQAAADAMEEWRTELLALAQ